MTKQRHIVFALMLLFVTGVAANLILLSTSGSSTGIPLFQASGNPYPTAPYSPALVANIASGECLKSFSAFAYHITQTPEREAVMPPSWQMEAVIPAHEIPGYSDNYWYFQVVLTRSVDGHSEIWLNGQLWAEDWKTRNKPMTILYQPETQKWEFISAEIADTGLWLRNFWAGNLFVTEDGTVWGKTGWRDIDSHSTLKKASVLSRFNETTRQFELAEGALEVPLTELAEYYEQTDVVLDDNGIFWIFAARDGIYRYDPILQTTLKYADLTNAYAGSPVLSSDGSIYFARGIHRTTSTTRELFSLYDGRVAQLIPEKGQVIIVDTPDDGWPGYSGLLVDHTGKLWLGSIGYRDTDSRWHLIHPYPELYFESAGHYIWATPRIMLESSDGLLWFNKYTDSGWDGTAWYNPETGEGCMFTNVAANIIEDGQQQLWLVAEGKLYKHALS